MTLKYTKAVLILKKEVKNIYLSGSLPAKLYGLPKVHKDGNPMRPVLSTIGSANKMIAKVLNKYLKPFVENQYTCIARMCLPLHVKSLFTNVPINETIEICVRKFGQLYGESNCLLFKKLLTFA